MILPAALGADITGVITSAIIAGICVTAPCFRGRRIRRPCLILTDGKRLSDK